MYLLDVVMSLILLLYTVQCSQDCRKGVRVLVTIILSRPSNKRGPAKNLYTNLEIITLA
jgi:hypothetical protein